MVSDSIVEHLDALLVRPVVERSARRVWFVWTATTGYVVSLVAVSVFPTAVVDGSALVLSGLLLGIGGGVLVVGRSSRPPIAAAGVLFLLWGALDLFHSGPGVACDVPTEYVREEHVRFALDVGTWPTLGVTTDPRHCYELWYRLKLAPLTLGYALLGVGV